MGIENWGDFEETTEEIARIEQVVDDPRRHTLGGFQPGRGFGPSEAEGYEAPESLDFDETVEAPFPEPEPASPWKR